ncbi:MAG: response regulator [Cyanobacteria bacterium REEB67]|nr:response regulator [Cyanobacteria bacterium REEB67]
MIQSVLLVDDNENIRLVAEAGLERDYDVFLAGSGLEALDIAEAERPDLILLDVHMPSMDGLETLERLRRNQETAHIPVIFLTATLPEFRRHSLTEMGVIAVIEKPFDPLRLAELVSNLYASYLVESLIDDVSYSGRNWASPPKIITVETAKRVYSLASQYSGGSDIRP